MKKAIFPGTFDPFTLGHHSIVKRSLAFMDEVIIGIGINENKRCLLPVEKRLEGISKLYQASINFLYSAIKSEVIGS